MVGDSLKRKIVNSNEIKSLAASAISSKEFLINVKKIDLDTELRNYFEKSNAEEITLLMDSCGYNFKKKKVPKKLTFNKNHPQSFFATTRNIPEMKLEMMRYGITYTENEFFNKVMKSDDNSIESYFSNRIKRRSDVKSLDCGAIIQTNTKLKFEKLHYRLISLGEEWLPAENWLLFFLHVGRYVNCYHGELNILFSYISTYIPATITLAGYLDSYFSSVYKIQSLESEDKKIPNFNIGETINYRDGNTWRRGEIIRIFHDKSIPEKFNPYLEIEYKLPGEPLSRTSVPYPLWKDKVRAGGVAKKSSGKSSIVKVNDRISESLVKRYGQASIDYVRMKPSIQVNVIGRNVTERIKEISKSIQLSDKNGMWMPSDLIYLDGGFDSNYINTHVVKNGEEPKKMKTLSVFFGSKIGLDFWNNRTEKNLFFTSRTRQAHIEDTKLLFNNLSNSSAKNNEQKKAETVRLINFLDNLNIKVPAGVEIYVC